MQMDVFISINDLTKIYAGGVTALSGMSLEVGAGEIVALLGPNGAGKTSVMRILATLAKATTGTACVCGFDVRTHAEEVRRRIGYIAQTIALDPVATGQENLLFYGRLFGLTGARLRDRADSLMALFELESVANRQVRTYSGGMKRRLDLAMGLLHVPKVLLLDEPTNGLDPVNRHLLWDRVRALAREGIAVLLTTHYMDEADVLACRIAIIEKGRVVASGRPSDLKDALRGDIVTIDFIEAASARRAQGLLEREAGVLQVSADTTSIYVQVVDATVTAPRVLGVLKDGGIPASRISFSRPSLDEGYLSATGHKYDARGGGSAAAQARRS